MALAESAAARSEDVLSAVQNSSSTVRPLTGVVRDASMRLMRDEGARALGRTQAEFVERQGKFCEEVRITSDEPFVVEALVMTDGPLKGCQVHVVRPVRRVRFVDLPREIRDNIYEHLFSGEEPIQIEIKLDRPSRAASNTALKKKRRFPRRHALLRTSKQIAFEASPAAYGSSEFTFGSLPDLNLFLRSIPTMKKHLRKVTLSSRVSLVDTNTLALGRLLPGERLSAITLPCDNILLHALSIGDEINIKDLAHHLLPFFRRWNTVNHQRRGQEAVLDVVKFVHCYKCADCRGFKQDCVLVARPSPRRRCTGVSQRPYRVDFSDIVTEEFKKEIAKHLGLAPNFGPVRRAVACTW